MTDVSLTNSLETKRNILCWQLCINYFCLSLSLSLRLQCVLQMVCVCLSADCRLQTVLGSVSVLESMSDHQTLTRQLCSQHGEALPTDTAALLLHRLLFISDLCHVHAKKWLFDGFYLCFASDIHYIVWVSAPRDLNKQKNCSSIWFVVFFRPVYFPEVVPVHQNQTR